MSQVLYRKWRPQLLAEVAGQEHVTHTLLNALKADQISHAYLFCGPRGTGKTSTARILAKAVNCLNNGHGEPCNRCQLCQEITEGRAMDVIEIDAASNTGVDAIRELRERVNYIPGQARYKVYIIDEVHMLSTSASNALLKTLEEPPGRVIFVLATTEVHKMLPTIVSRCQRFDFRRLTDRVIVSKLQAIALAEGIEADIGVLRLIARESRGSLRDGENILQQMMTYYGKEIALSQAKRMLAPASPEKVIELLEYILDKDIATALRVIQDLSEAGVDLKSINQEIAEYLRYLLLIKTDTASDVDLEADEVAQLQALADKAELEQILVALKVFGHVDVRDETLRTLPLDLAVVDFALAWRRHEDTGAEIIREPLHRAASVPGTVKRRSESQAQPITLHQGAATEEPAGLESGEVSSKSDELERLQANWRQVMEQAPGQFKRSPTLAILRSAGVSPIAIEGNTVVLSFKYLYHKEKVEEVENKRVASEIISNFLGRSCEVKCVYKPDDNHLVREAQKLGARILKVEEK